MKLVAPNTEQVKACYVSDIYRERNMTPSERQEALTGARAEFDLWLEQVKADAWDEGYRDGHNDGLSDGHPLFNDREPEENPYREANDD